MCTALVKSGQVKDIADLTKEQSHSHVVELLVDWLVNYKTTDGDTHTHARRQRERKRERERERKRER
eukprot:COSAG03_NODE_1219_length_4536_cov_3.996169_1_plen_66_part_10